MGRVKKEVLRKCVGCGEMKDRQELVRIVRCAEGEVVIDETQKRNGRGAYVCRSAGKSREKTQPGESPEMWRGPEDL